MRHRYQGKAFLMLAPAVLILLVLFAGGVASAFVVSVGFFAPGGAHSFTLQHYTALLKDVEFRSSLLLTVAVAGASTLLSTIGGVLLALLLRHSMQRRSWLSALLQIPIAVPHIVMAVLLMGVMSQSGLLARLAYAAGLIEMPNEFPILVNDRYAIGIVIAYVLKETPFIAVVALAMLSRTGNEYEALASTLGASRLQRFRYVTLPLLAPAVVPASIVIFAFVFGAFEVPFLLGRTYPAMLGVVAQRQFMSADLVDRPLAMATGVLISLITAALVWAYLRIASARVGERPTLF